MSEICSITDCNREVFDNEKCILHCEKDDWFEIDEDKNKDWSRSKDNIKKFWEEIRSFLLVEKNVISFEYFIFPLFENTYKCVNVEETKDIEGKTLFHLFKNDANFWKEGEQLIFEKNLIFLHCIFYDSIDFKYTEFNKLFILNSKLNDSIIFNESTIKDEFSIDKTLIAGSCNIMASNFNNIFIQNAQIEKQINLSFSKIDSFLRINKSQISTIKIGLLSKFNIFKLENNIISDLIITGGSSCLDYMQFINSKANAIHFKDFDVYNCKTIYLTNCTTDDFIINNLIGQAEFTTLSDLIVNKLLDIENSNCSNFKFHNFNISNAKKQFKNISFISNNGFTILNGVKWGDINKIKGNRDTFRQLKYVNEKQGNIIEANKFYSAEMKAYKKELKGEKWKTHWQDKIIFWLNEKVSNFSQNWLKPLGWFFLIGFIAFVLSSFYKILSYLNDTSKITLTTIWNAFNQFFEYLNPFNTSAGEWYPTIWLIFKALSIFIIYQFIISLRRQTRR